MLKIEIIILSLIAVISFIIGVIINVIDMTRNREHNKPDKDKNSLTEVLSITKTLIDFKLPKVDDYDDPVIIRNIEVEEDKDK